jgi:hypothetical protein
MGINNGPTSSASVQEGVVAQPASTQNVLKKSKFSYAVGGIIILLVIVGVGYYTLSAGHSKTNIYSNQTTTSITNKNSSSTITIRSTTSVLSNGEPQNVSGGGGPGQSYLSRSEAISLLGPGGTYSALYAPNTQLIGLLPDTIVDPYNVTGCWSATYDNSNLSSNNFKIYVLNEFEYQSSKANRIYAAAAAQLPTAGETVIAINKTVGGLTYSYSSYVNLEGIHGNELIGYKNDEMVVIDTPQGINQTALASVIAADMP